MAEKNRWIEEIKSDTRVSAQIREAVAVIAEQSPPDLFKLGSYEPAFRKLTNEAFHREIDYEKNLSKGDTEAAKGIVKDRERIGARLASDIEQSLWQNRGISEEERKAIHTLTDGQKVDGKTLTPADVDKLLTDLNNGMHKESDSNKFNPFRRTNETLYQEGKKLHDSAFTALSEALGQGVDGGIVPPLQTPKSTIEKAAVPSKK